MVTVTVSETYDLSTQVDKMGVVGIHTPTGTLIDKLWGGLVSQYRKFRFVKCDVAMACASMLPADPLQVGIEAGEIAPQDMFNPILFRAVSNDALSNILSYIISLGAVGGDGTTRVDVNQGSVVSSSAPGFKLGDADRDQHKMYYGLLTDSSGWRKSMPQAGLSMRGLYPLVYQVVSNFGSNSWVANASTVIPDNKGGGVDPNVIADTHQPRAYVVDSSASTGITSYRIRGPSMRMPFVDTVCFVNQGFRDTNVTFSSNGANVVSNTGKLPPCYVGLIVLPPAVQNKLYYRLKVTWTVEFTGLRSLTDIVSWPSLETIGDISYGTDYATQSQAMSSLETMLDAESAVVTKVMEGR